MTAQEKHEAKLETYFKDIGLKAVLKHPKAKLWAKVNHADNFALATYGIADDEIMDDVADFTDPKDWDWWNKVTVAKNGAWRSSRYSALVTGICLTAYEKLRQ